MAFESLSENALTLHPHKRVKYTTGLVLGVDEFRQADWNHEQKKRRHCRGLHGYGIVSGLLVQVDNLEPTKPVTVEPGFAVDVSGRDLCVTTRQCGSLLNWVRQQDLGVGPQQAYVVLCYDECETDEVPVLAGPCLSHDQRTVASRVLERFRLEFRTAEEAPRHEEEPALRQLSALMLSLDLVRAGSAVDDVEQLLTAVRSLADETPIPLSTPFRVDAEMVRQALGTWTREVRPRVAHAGGPCEPFVAPSNSKADQACVVLARLSFVVESTGSALVIPGDVTKDDASAPLLVPTQLTQTLALMGLGYGSVTVERSRVVSANSMARLGAPVPRLQVALGAVQYLPAAEATNPPRQVARLPLPHGFADGSELGLRLVWETTAPLVPSQVEWEVDIVTQAAGASAPDPASSVQVTVTGGGGTDSAGELVLSTVAGVSVPAPQGAAMMVVTLSPVMGSGATGAVNLHYLEMLNAETLHVGGGL